MRSAEVDFSVLVSLNVIGGPVAYTVDQQTAHLEHDFNTNILYQC